MLLEKTPRWMIKNNEQFGVNYERDELSHSFFICAQREIQKFPDYHPTSAGTGVKKKLLVKKQILFRIPAVTIGLSNCTRRPTLNYKYYINPSFTQGENLEKSLLLMGAGQFTPNFHPV